MQELPIKAVTAVENAAVMVPAVFWAGGRYPREILPIQTLGARRPAPEAIRPIPAVAGDTLAVAMATKENPAQGDPAMWAAWRPSHLTKSFMVR